MNTMSCRLSENRVVPRTRPWRSRVVAVTAAASLTLISLGTGANAQVSNWYDSFESYTAGSSLIGQGGWIQLSGSPPGSNQLVTVESNPSVAVTGSQYLRIQTMAGVVQSVTHIQDIKIGTDGTIQWFANAQQTLGSSLGVTLVGNQGGSYIAKVNFGCCGGFNYSSNTTQIAGGSYESNTWYGFKVHMNGPAKTYDLDIFKASDNSSVLSAANIPYFSPTVITNFYFIGFNTDAAAGLFFVDSINVIPEPGALSLLAVAGLLLWRRLRRNG